MNYNHIEDCWNELEKATTLKEVKTALFNFPIKSGYWGLHLEDTGDSAKPYIVVIVNSFDEGDTYGLGEEKRELPNVVLTEEELSEFDCFK